jgi:hypothetical protein
MEVEASDTKLTNDPLTANSSRKYRPGRMMQRAHKLPRNATLATKFNDKV